MQIKRNKHGNLWKSLILLACFGVFILSGCVLTDLYAEITEKKPVGVTGPPAQYWTVKEASQYIMPYIVDWHEDARILSAAAINADDPEWKLRPDGRSPWWYFRIYSSSAEIESAISLLGDTVVLGIDRIPGNELPRSGFSGQAMDLDAMIDSDRVLAAAYQSGVEDGYTPQDMRWQVDEGQPETSSWNINFWRGEIFEPAVRIVIDAMSSEVILNEFLDQIQE